MRAIRAARKETVPGVSSCLPALAGEAFGTFALTLSGAATLLATARISHSTAATVSSQIAVSVAFGRAAPLGQGPQQVMQSVYAGSCRFGGVGQ